MSEALPKLLILDIVGFDRRRITKEHAPICHELFERFGGQVMDGQPTTEVWPALVSGVNPGVEGHLLWHAKRKPAEERKSGALGKLINNLPDWMVTTAQLFPYFFYGHKFDVPAMPRWRRHQIEFHRLKYPVRSLKPDKYNVVGGAKTMFHAMGDRAIHEVVGKFENIDAAVEKYPTEHPMQFLEFHCFDLVSHWYLDNPEVMAEHIKICDNAVGKLIEKCEEQGTTFVLLVEHGQEQVLRENHVNLRKLVHDLDVPRDEYCFYNGVAVAKFWFDSDRAREEITAAVKTLPHTSVLTCDELNERLDLTLTPEWGELYVIRDSGHLFHPHDYYHPLGNIFVGLRNKSMRKRMFDPYHRGYHGYLPGPDAKSEDAWAVVANDKVEPMADKARLMDFAPSMLHLLGEDTPEYMTGHPTFRFKQASPAATPASTPEPEEAIT